MQETASFTIQKFLLTQTRACAISVHCPVPYPPSAAGVASVGQLLSSPHGAPWLRPLRHRYGPPERGVQVGVSDVAVAVGVTVSAAPVLVMVGVAVTTGVLVGVAVITVLVGVAVTVTEVGVGVGAPQQTKPDEDQS